MCEIRSNRFPLFATGRRKAFAATSASPRPRTAPSPQSKPCLLAKSPTLSRSITRSTIAMPSSVFCLLPPRSKPASSPRCLLVAAGCSEPCATALYRIGRRLSPAAGRNSFSNICLPIRALPPPFRAPPTPPTWPTISAPCEGRFPIRISGGRWCDSSTRCSRRPASRCCRQSESRRTSPAASLLCPLQGGGTSGHPKCVCDQERLTVAAVLAPTVIMTAAHVVLRPQHARKPDEAVFLIVVEALVKWRTGIGDLFQRSAGFGHGVGALRQALERRARLLLLLFAGLPRLQPLDPQLNEIAHRLIERRPVF